MRHRVLHWPGPVDKPSFLLLHGWLDLADSFDELASKLCHLGSVFSVDFRGHGHTQWIGAGGYYHFIDYLRDVSALLDHLDALSRPIYLVGHSMGGTVSTLVAGTHADRILGLVLMEGSGPPARPADAMLGRSRQWLEDLRRFGTGPKYFDDLDKLRARVEAVYPEFSRSQVERFCAAATCHDDGKGWRWRYDPLHRTTSPTPFQQSIYLRFAGAYHGPTLHIYGEKSALARRDDPQLWERMQGFSGPIAEEAIAGAGHMMHFTHPKACAAAIESWLKKSAPSENAD